MRITGFIPYSDEVRHIHALYAPEPAQRAVATGRAIARQRLIPRLSGRTACGQSAIKRRIVGDLIPKECAERSPERLLHLRLFDLVRRRFKYATKHEIGDMREAFWGL
jgi:hypothetical protein